MIVVAAFVGGGILGWVRATKCGGTMGERVQYALAHAIPAALLAMLAVIIAAHMGILS